MRETGAGPEQKDFDVREVVNVVLTPKQERFVQEYLVDLNATQAAIRAGYSKKTADRIGPELLGKTCVSEAIQEKMRKRSQRTEITADMVLKEFAKLAFFDPRKLFDANGNPKDITELDDDTAAALAGLDVVQEVEPDSGTTTYTKRYKLASKQAALDSLGRHLGMFTDRVENKVDAAVRIELGAGLDEMAE